MSQAKVERYKEQKANRKEIMKKQKRKKMIGTTIVSICCVVVIGWVGYSGVVTYQDSLPREEVEVDYATVQEYLEEHISTEE